MTAEEVIRLHIGFNRALERQDYQSLEAIYSDRYILIRPDGSILNKEQVLKDLREGGLSFQEIELKSPIVRVFGSAAILPQTAEPFRRVVGSAQRLISGSSRCTLRRAMRSGWFTFRALRFPKKWVGKQKE